MADAIDPGVGAVSAGQQKAGPAIGAEAHEVQAVFASNAALEEAIGRLREAGFDHADLSLPHARPAAQEATPEQGADDPLTHDDTQQMRTMETSMAGTVGAFAAAGVTVATGGAALAAAAAAAAVGAGAAAIAHTARNAAVGAQQQGRDEAARRGELVLAVRTTDADRRGRAEALLRAAGATRIAAVDRTDADVTSGIDSAAWTG